VPAIWAIPRCSCFVNCPHRISSSESPASVSIPLADGSAGSRQGPRLIIFDGRQNSGGAGGILTPEFRHRPHSPVGPPVFRRPETCRAGPGSVSKGFGGAWNSNCSTSSETGRECAGPVPGSTVLPDTAPKDSAGFRTRSRNKDEDRTLLPPRLPLKFPQSSGTGPIRLRFFERAATQTGASLSRTFRRHARSRLLAAFRAEPSVASRKSL
jgi:hypothetical protein